MVCKRTKAIGDGVIARERDYILALRSLVAEAKRHGLTADWLAANRLRRSFPAGGSDASIQTILRRFSRKAKQRRRSKFRQGAN